MDTNISMKKMVFGFKIVLSLLCFSIWDEVLNFFFEWAETMTWSWLGVLAASCDLLAVSRTTASSGYRPCGLWHIISTVEHLDIKRSGAVAFQWVFTFSVQD